ncbi:hypothetical protein D3C76_1402940 [compost metagenome]
MAEGILFSLYPVIMTRQHAIIRMASTNLTYSAGRLTSRYAPTGVAMIELMTNIRMDRQCTCPQREGKSFTPAAISRTNMAGTIVDKGNTNESDMMARRVKPKPEKPRATAATKTQHRA